MLHSIFLLSRSIDKRLKRTNVQVKLCIGRIYRVESESRLFYHVYIHKYKTCNQMFNTVHISTILFVNVNILKTCV